MSRQGAFRGQYRETQRRDGVFRGLPRGAPNEASGRGAATRRAGTVRGGGNGGRFHGSTLRTGSRFIAAVGRDTPFLRVSSRRIA